MVDATGIEPVTPYDVNAAIIFVFNMLDAYKWPERLYSGKSNHSFAGQSRA